MRKLHFFNRKHSKKNACQHNRLITVFPGPNTRVHKCLDCGRVLTDKDLKQSEEGK